MSGLLAAVLVPLACAAGWLYTARLMYARWRPFTEPISCDWPYPGHRHHEICYRRPGTMIDSTREAACLAALAALGFPLVLIYLIAERLITAGVRSTPDEMAAKIARLEKELRQ